MFMPMCHLLITFANNLDPAQARHLEPNCLIPEIILRKDDKKKHEKLPIGKGLIFHFTDKTQNGYHWPVYILEDMTE